MMQVQVCEWHGRLRISLSLNPSYGSGGTNPEATALCLGQCATYGCRPKHEAMKLSGSNEAATMERACPNTLPRPGVGLRQVCVAEVPRPQALSKRMQPGRETCVENDAPKGGWMGSSSERPTTQRGSVASKCGCDPWITPLAPNDTRR